MLIFAPNFKLILLVGSGHKKSYQLRIVETDKYNPNPNRRRDNQSRILRIFFFETIFEPSEFLWE